MEGSGELPPVSRNALRRLEEGYNKVEKGAEAALMTQTYHLFEGLKKHPRCEHYCHDDEYEAKGELFVVKISKIEERIGDQTVTLVYARTFNYDSDGNEILDPKTQQIRFLKQEGDVVSGFELPLPDDLDSTEITTDIFREVAGKNLDDTDDYAEEKDSDTTLNELAALDAFTRRHINEVLDH